MKILHIGKFYFPYKGGMETVIKTTCEGLAQEGHDVTVLCSNTERSFSREVINQVKILRSPTYGILFSQPLSFFIPIFLFLYAKKYDVIHFHCPNPLVEFFSMFTKHKNKYCTHHSDIVRQKVIAYFYIPFYRAFIKSVKKIIIPTRNHIKYSSMISGFESKCEIIPFFINDSRLNMDEEVRKEAKRIESKHGRFGLFVGRIVGYKGLEYLVQACKKVDHKVIIIGSGILEEKIEKLIIENHLEKKVIMLGRIDSAKTFAAFYHACHYVVLPSISPNENFGMVQLEAMYCSKPVLTTNLKSGVPAVGIPDQTTLLVEPENIHELASEMTKLVNDEVLAKRLGNNGKKLYIQKYKKKMVIDALLRAYGAPTRGNELRNDLEDEDRNSAA